MHRDDDKFAGMLAVIEEQQAAANLAVDRLTTIVETLAELGCADWQRQVAADTAQRAAAKMERRCRESIDAATKGASTKIQQDMQAAAQNVERGAQDMEAVTGKMASAADKLEKSLWKVLVVPLCIAALCCGGAVAWTNRELQKLELAKKELNKEIDIGKITQQSLEAEPLTKTLITTCEKDGQRWWCIPVVDDTETWTVKGTPWTYRRIDGLPPVK